MTERLQKRLSPTAPRSQRGPSTENSDRSVLSRQAYRIPEACEAAGIGRTALYGAIKEGRLIAHKAGRRTIILHTDLVAYLASLPRVGEH
jgi:excisionase family DNA binding protein